MNAITARGEEIMTDFQFKSLIKMILGYVEETEDIEKIKKYLLDLLGEEDKGDKGK